MIKKTFKIVLVLFSSIILVGIVLSLAVPIYIYFTIKPEELYSLIENTNKIVITKKNIDKNVIYTSTNIEDIQSFKASLNLEKKIEWSISSCRGVLGINLYNNEQRISRIAYLTNSHIRDEKVGYITIQNKKVIEKWFHDRNISTYDD